MSDEQQTSLVIENAIILYPYLFQVDKRFVKADQAGQYKADLLIDREGGDFKALMQRLRELAAEHHPGVDIRELHLPVSSGDVEAKKMADKGKDKLAKAHEGKVLVKANSIYQPQVVDAQNHPIIDSKKVYSGCQVAVDLGFKAYDGNGSTIKPGIKLYLNMVMKRDDGDRLSGRSAADVFAGITSKPATNAKEFDDDIPF